MTPHAGRDNEPALSVVVPTRNEAGNVETLVSRLASVLRGLRAEAIFIDDSDDETSNILARLQTESQAGLTVIAQHRPPERRTGLGSAAAEGMRLARGPVVGVMDGDLQHPPELLRELMSALEAQGVDIVVASRYTRGGSAHGLSGPARGLVSVLSRFLVQLLFREARKTSDPLSGYFLCRRSAIEGLEFRPIGFKILLEILVCAPKATVGDVPLRFAPRHSGRSNAGVTQGWAFMRHVSSLLVQVPGSARFWKYALVGGSGLALFLGLLLAGRFWLRLSVFQSWSLAFAASLFFNWQLNRIFTFADIASPFTPGRSRPVYLPAALLGGCANLVVFTVLLANNGSLMLDGAGGALAAMALNYLVHRSMLTRPPRPASEASDHTRAIVERLGRLLSGELLMLPSDIEEDGLGAFFAGHPEPPGELLRAAARRKPILIAEAPSHVPQARHDVGLAAWMGIPVLEGRRYLGLLVAHRQGRPYTAEELEQALRSLRSDSRDRLPHEAGALATDTKQT